MIACALTAAPKSRPPAGTPPITPGSAVSVSRSLTFSSAATAATPSGMPMPRFTTLFGAQLHGRARAMTLRRPIGSARRTATSPRRPGCRRREGLRVVSGASATTTQSTSTPGILTCAGLSAAALGDALDLRDDQAAAVVHRDRQPVERERLALHRDVAVRVGGGAADDGDMDRERLVEQEVLAADAQQRAQVLGGALVELAAAVARIDERAEADAVRWPGLPAAMSRNRCEMTPCGRL